MATLAPQTPIAQWNRMLESGSFDALPSSVWDEWIWESDMHERLTPQMMLNKSHLLGLLVARFRALRQPESMQVRLCQDLPNIVHGHIMVSDMTVRQLRETAEDLQMHWTRYSRDWDAASRAVDAVTARFGQLNLAPCPPALWSDDPASMDPERPGCLSVPAIRRFTCLLCVFYRHLSLASLAISEQDDESLLRRPHPEVENYHVQAGLEDFYRHSMMADLPPAARIIYKQDFQGMYHCVTQVVYMHFPSYDRKQQYELQEVRDSAGPIHTLSVMLQLHPDAHVIYEDETLRADKKWNWVLMSGGAVYLVSGARDRVYTAECLWSLMAKADDEGGVE